MIRPIRVAPLTDVRMISENPIVPNTMTNEEYLRNQFATPSSAPLTPNMAARPPVQAPSLLSDVGTQMSQVGQAGLVSQQPEERTAKTLSQRVKGLLDNPEGGAALQGAFATLTAMGRPVKRGESRLLGAVELGRQVYGQERDRAMQQQLADAKMMEALRKGQADRFRPLTAEEKQRIGISEFQPAQINLSTGEIDTFGGGLNYQGTLEQGTELFRTASGGVGVRPIQGSKGARAQTAERTAEEMALVGKNTSYNRVMNLTGEIADLLNQGEGEFGVTGLSGQVVGALGLAGTDRRSLEKKYGTLRANIGFDRLQQMRDESPTGGALGQVAVQELDALQSSLDALDPNLKPEEQMASLRDVQTHYENVLILSAMATRADDSEWDDSTLKKLGVYDDVQNILIRRSADEYGISEQDLRDAIDDPDTRDLFPILSIDQAFSGFQVPELRQ